MLWVCPTCTRSISVEARECPGCGLPITQERRARMIKGFEERQKFLEEAEKERIRGVEEAKRERESRERKAREEIRREENQASLNRWLAAGAILLLAVSAVLGLGVYAAVQVIKARFF